MDQQPLHNVPLLPQMCPPHPARVVDMREASLQQLSPLTEQLFAALAPDASPVSINRRLLEKGKEKLQALVAVMRKLLHAIFGMFKHHQSYAASQLVALPAEPCIAEVA